MGCSCSSVADDGSKQVIRAATIIQNWYRGYRARLKARQRCALTIFRSIEYADEQGQMQLSNFFSFMFENYAKAREKDPNLVTQLFGSSFPDTYEEEDYTKMINVPDSYNGPRLQFPLTFNDIEILIEGFKEQKILHPHYVLAVLHEAKKVLMKMPNVSHIRTLPYNEITVCGDLHGKLEDLLLIFYKNGLPSDDIPYVFNGDFVDRGKNSIEILMILLVSLLVYPKDLRLNRGNHEDILMNMRYGFTKEIMQKYKLYGREILKVLEEVYTWLPIATIIDNEILIMHGGLSMSTDLNLLHRLERHKMKSVLMPPVQSDEDTTADVRSKIGGQKGKTTLSQHEWKQVIDILWSDPRSKRGCYPNKSRGGGCYFGPDVTAKILSKYQMKFLIRSHECKPDGYEICHDGKVITVFSASNYYEEGSNRGAYVKLGRYSAPRFFQYQVTNSTCPRPLHQRVSTIEGSAIRILKERMVSRKTDLVRTFELHDCSKSGKLSLSQWALSMESVLELNLPWRSLSVHLVNRDKDGKVEYMSSFQDVQIKKPVKEAHSSLIETLYRYRSDLQIIFNVIDTDHSGLISMEEFRDMWKLFKTHYGVHVDDIQVDELANQMDLNKDGSIDFNEFLKAFHVVHKFDTLHKSDTLAFQE
ncbi:PREDICTED: serine/threonine-protein phosphatase with EF-hands 1 [Chrysochloris asiatica]|uniref:Serine/threonine-protein phosphatase with EF-hands n=1 Tax=Chrysochloris asiatica TaxID=185453 RepID=A0A9B0WJY1_CHRAS|nr:PREDICTED: serine/threonine-protein phosphatase with EF-hands 1 [Chrysochloris asiatica]